MELPKIIISVTGGAQDFKLRRRLTEEFKKSLIKAAKNTGMQAGSVLTVSDYSFSSATLRAVN